MSEESKDTNNYITAGLLTLLVSGVLTVFVQSTATLGVGLLFGAGYLEYKKRS